MPKDPEAGVRFDRERLLAILSSEVDPNRTMADPNPEETRQLIYELGRLKDAKGEKVYLLNKEGAREEWTFQGVLLVDDKFYIELTSAIGETHQFPLHAYLDWVQLSRVVTG